ncbi:uncharacterized protein METZ01_LOCUS278243 [marine metagenome]|uniref:Uncharacterized protein n=1 Tax=marine metagenome TaxID=408172 RepID=A0A382KMD0_9ZZZZ
MRQIFYRKTCPAEGSCAPSIQSREYTPVHQKRPTQSHPMINVGTMYFTALRPVYFKYLINSVSNGTYGLAMSEGLVQQYV